MIITPARFEDGINKILSDNRSSKEHDLMMLMFDTLESMGYGAGINIIKGARLNDRPCEVQR